MKLQVEYVPINSIQPYANNAKLHPAEQIEQIKKSIEEFGFNDPIAVWHDTIVEGHGRLIAATEMGLETVPIIRLDDLTDEQRRAYTLVHNKLTMNSGFDIDLLDFELEDLPNFDAEAYGFELSIENFDLDENAEKGSMKQKYLVPPFSVIYGNKPDWIERKHAWIGKGIRSEIGRGGNLLQIEGAINRQDAYDRGQSGEEQSLQKQRKIKQIHNRSNAFSNGLITRMREMKEGGRTN